MENLEIYKKVASVPDAAKKTIGAGRLRGMTDINPMWRIMKLTELFGPCGIGWWYKITDKRMEPSVETSEVAVFVDIDLYYVVDGKTSQPVCGTGGATFVASEKSGCHMSDECFKMALTDAISVAAKALGVGADVYWAEGRTKYAGVKTSDVNDLADEPTLNALKVIIGSTGCTEGQILDWANKVYKVEHKDFSEFKQGQVLAIMQKLSERKDKK